MKIALSWLKEYIALPESVEIIASKLTSTGLEVEHIEAVERIKGGLQGMVIGQVLTCVPHPNADKLRITTVDVGAEAPLQIVCGAPNVAVAQKVIVATVGATLYPVEGEPFAIKKSKIRGELSEGMICAEDEIGLGKSHDGIMVLDTALVNGTPAAKYFNLENDFVLEIGLTPNRSDAASHLGVARDLRAVLGRNITLPQVVDIEQIPLSNEYSLKVKEPALCPTYLGYIVKGVKVYESPKWLKEKLEAIGLNPINNVVDITNYVLHSIGQPLHAFNLSLIDSKEIAVRTLEPGTQFITLDGVERVLNGSELMICNGDKPLAMAGIMGGKESGIQEDTKDIFLESAYFNPVSIRKSATAHGIKTDASFRYERGTDPLLPSYAAALAITLLKEVAGAEEVAGVVKFEANTYEPTIIEGEYDYLERLIGYDIPRERVLEILSLLDFEISHPQSDYGHQGFETSYIAKVPSYRVEVSNANDLAEEVIRIFGLDNIPLRGRMSSKFISSFPAVPEPSMQTRISNLLASRGFVEVMNNSLSSSAYLENISEFEASANVKVLNPISEDLNIMRRSLLTSLLQTAAYNINRRQADLKIFELGKVYELKEQSVYAERKMLAMLLTGNVHAETWRKKSELVQYHDLAQEFMVVLASLGLKVEVRELQSELFAYGQALVMNNRVVGRAGLVQPQFAKKLEVKKPVFYAELEWEYLISKYKTAMQYQEVSKFPEVRRDLSLVLNAKVAFSEVKRVALSTEKKLLKDINIFDVYSFEKEGNAEQKSYSVSFTLQDASATLTDAVIDKTMENLITAFEKNLGAVIRR